MILWFLCVVSCVVVSCGLWQSEFCVLFQVKIGF